MRRYFESLRPADVSAIHSVPDGIFLVRVDRAQYRWHKQKPYYEIRFAVLKPKHLTGCFMTGRLYCTPRAMWKLSWFLRDFGYDAELLGKNEIDDKALIDLWGVVKVSEVTVHGISLSELRRLCPGGPVGRTLRLYRQRSAWVGGVLMTYSYTQISQYLSCPRRYKHRYLDGWKEKDTRAAMLFGRAFEQAVAAYFQRQDAAAVLYREWSAHGTAVSTIPSGIAGTACCSRACSCSIDSPRTIGFASVSLGATCR